MRARDPSACARSASAFASAFAFAFAFAPALLVTACAGGSGPTQRPPPPPPVAASPSASAAGVAAPAPRPPPRKAHVTATFFDASGGGSWSSQVTLSPKPADLLTDCYQATLDDDPTVAGWIWVELHASSEVKTATRLRESSPLPAALIACVVERARRLSVSDGVQVSPGLLYVSLSSDPVR